MDKLTKEAIEKKIADYKIQIEKAITDYQRIATLIHQLEGAIAGLEDLLKG